MGSSQELGLLVKADKALCQGNGGFWGGWGKMAIQNIPQNIACLLYLSRDIPMAACEKEVQTFLGSKTNFTHDSFMVLFPVDGTKGGRFKQMVKLNSYLMLNLWLKWEELNLERGAKRRN